MRRLLVPRILGIAGLLAIAVLAAQSAAAQTVTDPGDTGAPNQLRTVIAAAAPGATIVIPAGTTITLQLGVINITKNLTIQGAGASASIIDGNGQQIFDIGAFIVVIDGVTLRGGSAQFGGAINKSNSGTLTLSNCAFSGNVATGVSAFGGAINGDVATITNCTFSGNAATASGGGAGAFGGAIDGSVGTITNSTFSGNAATATGGSASAFGGAIDGSVGTITGSTFSGNSATASAPGSNGAASAFGGAIDGSVDTIVASTFSGNSATAGANGAASAFGGAIDGGSTTITNSTFSGNSATASANGAASAFGGAIDGGGATIINSTFSGNAAIASAPVASVFGGGIDGSVTLHNTIVANSIGGDCDGSNTSLGHNLDSDGTCGLSGPGDLSGVNPLLAPLFANGGPTLTHALLPESPAIDAGDNAGCPPSDQRGVARPQGPTCDIGAYEFAGVVTSDSAQASTAAVLFVKVDPASGTDTILVLNRQQVGSATTTGPAITVHAVFYDRTCHERFDANLSVTPQGLATALVSGLFGVSGPGVVLADVSGGSGKSGAVNPDADKFALSGVVVDGNFGAVYERQGSPLLTGNQGNPGWGGFSRNDVDDWFIGGFTMLQMLCPGHPPAPGGRSLDLAAGLNAVAVASAAGGQPTTFASAFPVVNVYDAKEILKRSIHGVPCVCNSDSALSGDFADVLVSMAAVGLGTFHWDDPDGAFIGWRVTRGGPIWWNAPLRTRVGR